MTIARDPFRRGDVCLIELDPTRGTEIRKTRPCLVISPSYITGVDLAVDGGMAQV